MRRREAVLSVLSGFLTVPPKAASALMEAWDARHSITLIVSETKEPNLFVRGLLSCTDLSMHLVDTCEVELQPCNIESGNAETVKPMDVPAAHGCPDRPL
jgi:hypothetical protein